MARKNLLAANWKMNGSLDFLDSYFEEFRNRLGCSTKVLSQDSDLIFGLPYTLIGRAVHLLEGSHAKVAAQNCHWASKGAYTGEISPQMLCELAVQSCIIGHSERRQYDNETDLAVGKKVGSCISSGLLPIVCVGESQQEREQGLTGQVVAAQLKSALAEMSGTGDLVVAYEPVWAIGTGLAASPDDANKVHLEIRETLAKKFGSQWADTTRIVYGGSMKAENAKSFAAQEHIDGGLVGGASLAPADFAAIIKAFDAS